MVFWDSFKIKAVFEHCCICDFHYPNAEFSKRQWFSTDASQREGSGFGLKPSVFCVELPCFSGLCKFSTGALSVVEIVHVLVVK